MLIFMKEKAKSGLSRIIHVVDELSGKHAGTNYIIERTVNSRIILNVMNLISAPFKISGLKPAAFKLIT